MTKRIDRKFLISILLLSFFGIAIFLSASLGVLIRQEDKFFTIALNQIAFGLVGGMIVLFITSKINYKFWQKSSVILFILSLVVIFAMFIPGIGISHGGATRWINLGPAGSFQPSELLKFAYVIPLAALFAKHKNLASNSKGLLYFGVITVVAAIPLALEPDHDTLLMMVLAGMAIYFVSGAKWRYLISIVLIGAVFAAAVLITKPYVIERIKTFLDPSKNASTSGYQIQQSLVAIGSGGLLGKGFGQSTQKFGFLPEPIGDSIYAVASEEFGMIGSIGIIVLFLFFALRGLQLASRAQEEFGRLLSTGIVILIVSGSFINIASMLGLFPLSGTPLIFISHGGTALFLALAQVGIVLNISKFRK